ncbi:hypothetical protein MPTK1_4g23870 [Marchantia polymorpha subsp. ruderalis]|uniref:Uncharacterized protein n=2 Tax=Marchantia polymorpha TaxID=3197 RepID=A0AAF6BD52_MARPO|nr:hypothetical protein MARPO_0020s0146 [Marchantia polymorpha]BBN09936.1 hypothetical protein Mp_4g23870 [Marchantia polymorpha subsp. ruderalis]|eukprot:PTQ44510.1 hypothetical protein MARPO_0020s0146 [Marchantia polymorpha]
MTGEEKVLRSSLSMSGRSRTGVGGGGQAGSGAGVVTGSGYMAHGGDGKRRCSYKRATALICAVNVVAALYVLHGLFSPRYNQIPHSVPLARLKTPLRNGTAPLVMKYTKEEVQRIKEAHEARRAAEPLDLMRRVKEIQLESVKEAAKDKEAETTKQKVAADLAQRLRELRGNTNPHSQQEALDEWRKKKIEEARKRESEARDKEDTDENAKIEAQEEEVVAKTLELGWGPLLEAAGLTLPEETVAEKQEGGKLLLKGPEIGNQRQAKPYISVLTNVLCCQWQVTLCRKMLLCIMTVAGSFQRFPLSRLF